MPRFYTLKSQVPLRPGQTLGFQAGRGYYARGVAKDPLLGQASSLVEAQLAPVLQAIKDQQAEAQAQAAKQQEAMQGYNLAAAELLKGIGPQVQQGYADASQRTANFAKGYSVGMQMVQQGSADEANRLLAQNGAPAGQMQNPGSAAADVLYGTSGVIPATSLEREGAAFGAAASQLPATQLGMGRVSIQQLIEKAAEGDREFARSLREIEAKRPGLVQEALADLKDQQMKARAQKLNEQIAAQELGLKVQNQQFNQKAKVESLAQGRDRIAIQKYNAQLRRLQGDRQWQATLDRLGLQEESLRLRASQAEAKRRLLGKGGYTTSQRSQFAKRAGVIAKKAYQGVKGKDDQGEYTEYMTYQEAIRDMLAQGIPLVIAQRALNQYWSRPGATNPNNPDEGRGEGRPYVKFQNRRRKKPKKLSGR